MTAALSIAGDADARLLLLGVEFEHAFERYLRCVGEANRVSAECDQRLTAFGVPADSARWHRLHDMTCGPWLENARDAGAAVDALSRRISAMPATTVPGLLVKAKTLPFVVVEQADDDARAETLHAFIDQVEAVAYGPMAC